MQVYEVEILSLVGSSGEKSLEEIESLLKVDSEFHIYYLLRANYFVNKSDNPKIRKCEIKHAVNRIVDYEPRENLRLEVQRKLLVLREMSKEKHVGKILKDLEKALEVFEREKQFVENMNLSIEECAPTSSFEHALLGGHLMKTGVDDGGNKIPESLNRSLDLNPKNFFALVRYSEFCKELNTALGKNKQLSYLIQATKIEPSYFEAKYHLGMLFSNGRINQFAILMFNDLVTILKEICENNSSPDFLRLIVAAQSISAMCYVRLGENDAAVRLFGNAIDVLTVQKISNIDPTEEWMMTTIAWRGKCFLQQGRFEESILDLTNALNLGYEPARGMRQNAVTKWKEKIMRS